MTILTTTLTTIHTVTLTAILTPDMFIHRSNRPF